MSSTIVAISTPLAPGGIGVIRISGPDAQKIADKVFVSASQKRISSLKGYSALFGSVIDSSGTKIDDAIALNFIAPKSFTGENVVELSCHGGIFIMRKLLNAVISAGASQAGPGEFTKRAFLNGKMDLAQAESVMEIISAQGERAARSAMAAKDGALSGRIKKITGSLIDLGAHLAAWADYPDDDIPQVDDDMLKTRLSSAKSGLLMLLSTFDAGRVLREGVNTVIAGRPNAGKSTLMNLLSGCERSIVTDFAGTTRDVVEETIMLGDIPLRLADTAGVRDTSDPIESIGVNIAKERIRSAQLVLAVFDASVPFNGDDMEIIHEAAGIPSVAVINKTDLEPVIDTELINAHFENVVYISAIRGEGTAELEKAVENLLITEEIGAEGEILYTERQRGDVQRALHHIKEAEEALIAGFTLDAVTVSVEGAISALLELTGERVSESVIASVFDKFCVGK